MISTSWTAGAPRPLPTMTYARAVCGLLRLRCTALLMKGKAGHKYNNNRGPWCLSRPPTTRQAATPEEISFQEEDFIQVEVQNENGWWIGSKKGTKKRGLFPGGYVEIQGAMKIKVPKEAGGGANASPFDDPAAFEREMDQALERAGGGGDAQAAQPVQQQQQQQASTRGGCTARPGTVRMPAARASCSPRASVGGGVRHTRVRLNMLGLSVA